MPEYRRIRWITGIFSVLIAFQSTATASENHSLPVRALTFLIIFGAVWLAMMILNRLIAYLILTIRPNANGLSGILCEHTITIDPDGLTELTPVNQSMHYWRGIYRVDSTSEHIFIYIQQNQAHTIPRRSFSSPEQADQFFRTASDYHQAAVQCP